MSRPIHLWRAWPQLAPRLKRAGRLVLLSDFDGTLAPIVRHPRRARLPAATRAALEELHQLPRMTLGIVSGRRVRELRRLVGMKDIHYVGVHGLEWARPGVLPLLRATLGLDRIRRMAGELRRALRALAGVWVEVKAGSIAVHYRLAGPQHARGARTALARLARRYSPQGTLQRGKKLLELLPPGAMGKAGAVEIFLARRRGRSRPVAVYLGDDAADEAVFARLGKGDLGILVGRPRRSYARFYLRSPAQVCEFFGRLREVRL